MWIWGVPTSPWRPVMKKLWPLDLPAIWKSPKTFEFGSSFHSRAQVNAELRSWTRFFSAKHHRKQTLFSGVNCLLSDSHGLPTISSSTPFFHYPGSPPSPFRIQPTPRCLDGYVRFKGLNHLDIPARLDGREWGRSQTLMMWGGEWLKSVGCFRKDSFEDEEEEIFQILPPEKLCIYIYVYIMLQLLNFTKRLEQRPVKLWEYGLRGEDLKWENPLKGLC